MSHSTPARRCRLSLVCALGALLLASPAPAGETPTDSAALPPRFADREHVLNGCHLSTLAYLARFSAAHPEEHAEAVVISTRNPVGRTISHTVALVSWAGKWFGRDEFLGIVPLDRDTRVHPVGATLHRRLELVVNQLAAARLRLGGARFSTIAPDNFSPEERLAEIRTAARIVGGETRLFWVRTAHGEHPVLLFRPTEASVAVYDPLHGTCLPSRVSRSDSGTVEYVARRLGYEVEAVRPERAATNTLVALAR